MIEYLERLVEEKKFVAATDLAEELLRRTDNCLAGILAIQYALLVSRYELGQLDAAVTAGEATTKLAQELKEWDYFGISCLDLSGAYLVLKQYDNAIRVCERYVQQKHLYQRSARFEPYVWYNIGLAQGFLGKRTEALAAYGKAMEVAEGTSWERGAHGIRQAVIQQYLNIGMLPPVLGLLVKTGHFLRHSQGTEQLEDSRCFRLQFQVEFALKTNRLHRATVLSLKGLKGPDVQPRHRFSFHMLLARIGKEKAALAEACLHGVAAQEYAKHLKRYDLASRAADFIYEVADDPGDL